MADVLVKQPNRKVLQQGWSPQCYSHPASDGAWGVLKTTAIQPGRFDPEHNKELPSALEPKSAIEVHEGDLLLTCAGPRSRCGVPALVRSTPKRLMMSGKMYRFRPDDRLDPRFLEGWLLSPVAQKIIDEMKTGISDSGLNLTHGRFATLPVPVPPVAEQRRIVAILEDHLSRLYAAENYLRESERRVEGWRSAATQRELWTGDPAELPVGALLREPMRNGKSDRAIRGTEAGTRTLTLTAVTRNAFTDEFTKLTVTPPEVAQGLWLEPGDILVQRANTPELVGTAARYDGPKDWAIFPDLLIRLRPDEAAVDGRFLVAALRSEKVHRKLRARAKGLAGSMPKIDQRSIAETTVPVPSPSRQREVIDRLAEIEGSAKAALIGVQQQRLRSSALRRALLGAAFSGRLTHEPNLALIEEQVERV